MIQGILIFSSLIFALSRVSANTNIDLLWIKHKQNYDLKFTDAEDEQKIEIFKSNLDLIEKHNKMPSTFKLGMNLFGHMTHEEYLKYILQSDSIKNSHIQNKNRFSETIESFSDIDWRTKKAVTAVQNQGHCGSCWAFSVTGSLEGQMAIKMKKLLKLSEKDLVDCSHEYHNNGCKGGLAKNAYEYIIDHGISNASYYPYKPEDGVCRHTNNTIALKIKGFQLHEDKNEIHLSETIFKVGPISVSIDASDIKFQFYKSGIFESSICSSDIHNHAVLAVGLGSKPAKHYIVKNSWGNSWGNDGYILIARDKHNMCGIATYYSYPVL